MTYTKLQTLLTKAKAYPTPDTFAGSDPTTDSRKATQIWLLSQDMTAKNIFHVTHTDPQFWENRYGIPAGTCWYWLSGKRKPADYLSTFIAADLLTDQYGTELTFSGLKHLLATADLCASEEEFVLSQASSGIPKKVLRDLWELHKDFAIPTTMALMGTTRVTLHTTYGIPLRTVEDWCARKTAPKPYLLTFIAADLLSGAYRD